MPHSLAGGSAIDTSPSVSPVWKTLGLALVFWLGMLCHAAEGPYIKILGTAQDGGLPQIGCNLDACTRARNQPSFRRLVTSLALVDPAVGKRWLFEATPDLKEQVALLPQPQSGPKTPGGRPPLFDGIFLTHAHMGHYTGLVHLGREAYNHPTIPLYGSERMCRFLKANGPWDLLFQNGNLLPNPLQPDQPLALGPGIEVLPFQVPHREEYSDTLGYIIRGPNRSLLFIPDIDKWERWERQVETLIARVDVALLDGTFFADGEIPGRAMADIPHPFIQESLERFGNLPAEERRKIRFIHLNHTNPAADPAHEAAKKIREAGMGVAADGDVIAL